MEISTVYLKAPTTSRPAEKLARRHGFESVSALAEMLPYEARVLDVGAGVSPFGKEVAGLRSDISWVNFDYSYRDPAILEEASLDAPANVEYVAGDATELSEVYEAEEFDMIFSYWLLPHLSLVDKDPAKRATHGMFEVTKEGGLLSIGPKARTLRIPAFRSGKAIQTIKSENLEPDVYSHMIADKTQLREKFRHRQKLINEVVTPVLGTSRHTIREGHKRRIYHPDSESYVSPFTPKGVRTIGSLVVATARHLREK